MRVAILMREVSTTKRFWIVSADYANEHLACAAAVKDYPGCVVVRYTFPSQEQYDTFVAYVHEHQRH